MPRKAPPVTEKKLGRHKADGLWVPGDEDTGEQIFVDPRLKPKRRFEVVIHEFLHHRFPAWTEERVTSEAKHMTNFLWKHGYRKVEQ